VNECHFVSACFALRPFLPQQFFRNELKKNIFLFIGSVIVTLIVAEILVRIFIPQETKRLAIYDKELGWRGQPNGEARFIRSEDNIDVPFHYNELGFRDDRILSRDSVSTRVLFLGDSFVENLEIEFEKSFPHLTERLLQERFDARMDVVAVASHGYATSQEVLGLKKYGGVLKPNVVLLVFFTGNDFDDNMRRQFAYLDEKGTLVFPPNTDSWFKVQRATAFRWLYENSYLVFYVKNALESYTALKMEDASKAAAHESEKYQFEITKQLILAGRDEAARRNAKFGLVLITSRNEVKDGLMAKSDFVERVCSDAGIPFIETRSFLTLNDFYEHDVHFTAEGHRKVAEAIVNFLATQFGDVVKK
jgi:lysophospholipase L1-like esterase